MEKQNKQLLTESSRYATAAVKYDSSGDHERAFEFYLMTVQLLSICISNETNPKTKQALANRANEYLLRAEQIKEKLRFIQKFSKVNFNFNFLCHKGTNLNILKNPKKPLIVNMFLLKMK